MRLRSLLLLIALLASPVAEAQPFQGLYIGAGAGYNMPMGFDTQPNAPNAPATTLHPDGGVVAVGSIGYGLGNGIRFEIEGNFRQSNGASISSPVPQTVSARLRTYGVLANALFDMDIGVPWLYPYLGAGAGYAWTRTEPLTIAPVAGLTDTSNDTQGNFAFQAIAGLSFPVPRVPGLSIGTEYRFFGLAGKETFHSTLNPGAIASSVSLGHQYEHGFLLGVRYAFNVAVPTPAPEPPPAAPSAAAAARSYLVFFDWDKASLTDRARQVIKEAADNSTRTQYTRIEVNGYADTSGTHRYNQGLSVRRARAVQAELVKDGVPKNVIAIQGFGDTNLLVATGPGVREPQNRRVEIIIR
jgi:outer membrane protein OmpA-like peptidoglycan-associated protein/opacity protein-like surface antigen